MLILLPWEVASHYFKVQTLKTNCRCHQKKKKAALSVKRNSVQKKFISMPSLLELLETARTTIVTTNTR